MRKEVRTAEAEVEAGKRVRSGKEVRRARGGGLLAVAGGNQKIVKTHTGNARVTPWVGMTSYLAMRLQMQSDAIADAKQCDDSQLQ